MVEIKRPKRIMIEIEPWLSETAAMSAHEVGALLLLKMFYWRTGPILDNDKSLSRIVGMEMKDWKKARKALEPLFIVGGGEWLRIDWNDEIEAAYRAVAKAKEKGKNAITARWDRQKRGEMPYSKNTPSIPQVFPMNTPAIVNNKSNPPSQGKDGFDYSDPATEQVISGLESGWNEKPSIMARGFGAVEAEKGANRGL